MHRLTRPLAVLIGAVLLVIGLAACSTGGGESSADKARADRTRGVETIRKNQPVQPMEYSPTLATINRWAETWGQKGKVSYVYMQRADGEFAGYYVLAGLPVNYCQSGSPTYDFERRDSDSGSADQQVPAPGLDGAYAGGCDASRYYGFDAVSGQYVEYTDGLVLTAVLSDAPLSLDRQPTAFGSTIEEVKAAE